MYWNAESMRIKREARRNHTEWSSTGIVLALPYNIRAPKMERMFEAIRLERVALKLSRRRISDAFPGLSALQGPQHS